MDRLDAMHKFFLVARRYQLCSQHVLDLEDLARAPINPKVRSEQRVVYITLTPHLVDSRPRIRDWHMDS